MLRTLIRGFLNEEALDRLHQLKQVPGIIEKHRTGQLLAAAVDQPAFLTAEQLDPLQNSYPFLPEYGYDPGALETRGRRRAAQLLAFPGFGEARSILEVGCWDGMVSGALAKTGKRVSAIDNRNSGIDERAITAGVDFREMDATGMQFEDGCFDAVFSYDTFEHVARPERMLKECIRVVKKGGVIYLNFGPLYMSPFGEHAYRSIKIPYCQHLFPLSVLNTYAGEHGLTLIDPAHVNRWRLQQYRELWETHSDVLERLRYRETIDISHLNVMRRYPSCFRSKSPSLDEFIVSGVRILLRRIG